MKRLLFILIVIFVVVYFQFISINKNFNDFTVLQYSNPNKDFIEKILFEKRITIFTNLELNSISYNNNPIMLLTPKLYTSLAKEQHTDILKTLKTFFEYYYLPMNISSDISINYEKRETRTNLKEQSSYRYGICQFLGTRKLYLFPPNNKELLYYSKNTPKFEVNFWNQDTKLYPKVVESKYLEIVLYPGQLIFIPHNWIFCYEMVENSMSVSFFSESIFTNLLKNKFNK